MATLPSADSSPRIAALDVLRGAAVMGILAMNIVAFAMPFPAYFNPLAFGDGSLADHIAYALSFIFVDGKMRGLFSLLFGASMLLVISRAEAAGRSAASVTYRRLLWLLLFGAVHFYLIWMGDILMMYAMVGIVAFFFRRTEPRKLVRWGIVLLAVQLLLLAASTFYASSLAAAVSAPNASPETVTEWQDFASDFTAPTAAKLQEMLALHRGPWAGIVENQVTEHLGDPFFFTFIFGAETLAYMLFGMAALKTGFITGDREDRRYRELAIKWLAIAVPAYALITWMLFADGFTVPCLFAWHMTATVPFRPLMILAYAALIILATRRGGWLVDRIAAAGRAAFTNYLGTSIAVTGLFYGWGLGLYGSIGRVELYLVVLAAWVVMLAWSKPWLDRFAYGPFEWLWRSLARWELQPMRKRLPAAARA